MRILIDTNVIIDALTSRESFNKDAEQLFLLAANQIIDMHIPASAATDIYYLIRKHLHSSEQARSVMGKLCELFYILDVTAADCTNALASDIKDYEDAVVAACAARNQMECIVTRNIKDYEQSEVRAILPADFIRQLEEE